MHSIKDIRQDPEEFRKQLLRRNETVDVDELLELDRKRRELTSQLDELRRMRNTVSKKIGGAKKSGQDTEDLQVKMRMLGEGLKVGEIEEKRLAEAIYQRLMAIPNIPDDSTPEGADSRENVVVAHWGEPPTFDFDLLDHLTLAEQLGILDFPRGGKITGSGFPVWSGAGALLERALLNFMLDIQTREHGYREMITPFLGNRESMIGSGQIPHLEDDMYHCDKDDLFLIPTSEVMLVNLHRGEILSEDQLPIRYTANSPCFRREAGSWGRDTRGFQRTHQFNKVEMVRLEKPEDAGEALEQLIRHAETILRRLDLHYRTVHLCGGDLPFQASTCYDLEVWAPADGGRWLEVSSCSNCGTFQAQRASIRYRPKTGKTEYVHTLNGSGLATSRLMVALIETYQTEEQSFAIPPVLRPYMGGISAITVSE
ncbi:MAG: serine--tRNA ligase [Candidatus Electryoneaceae bacterium]|nr:serine--tRNA ligase [Candidatus Electryoneaceae bacterium]